MTLHDVFDAAFFVVGLLYGGLCGYGFRERICFDRHGPYAPRAWLPKERP